MRMLILFLGSIIVFSCSDIVSQRQEDLLKYDYLYPFVIKEGEYIKGTLNLDTNELTYSYKVKDLSVSLSNIEKKAHDEGWKKVGNKYEKEVIIYGNYKEIIRVGVQKQGDKIKIDVRQLYTLMLTGKAIKPIGKGINRELGKEINSRIISEGVNPMIEQQYKTVY